MACYKNPYPNQFLALRALEAIRAAEKPGKQPVRAYPCRHCHSWHLTSKKLTGKIPKWERKLSLTATWKRSPSHHREDTPTSSTRLSVQGSTMEL